MKQTLRRSISFAEGREHSPPPLMTSAPEGPALSQAGVFTTSREASSLAAPPSAIYNEDSGDRSGLAGEAAVVSAAAELTRALEKDLAAIAETASAELARELETELEMAAANAAKEPPAPTAASPSPAAPPSPTAPPSPAGLQAGPPEDEEEVDDPELARELDTEMAAANAAKDFPAPTAAPPSPAAPTALPSPASPADDDLAIEEPMQQPWAAGAAFSQGDVPQECMWMSKATAASLDWTGWKKIPAAHVTEFWVPQATRMRLWHKEAGWFRHTAEPAAAAPGTPPPGPVPRTPSQPYIPQVTPKPPPPAAPAGLQQAPAAGLLEDEKEVDGIMILRRPHFTARRALTAEEEAQRRRRSLPPRSGGGGSCGSRDTPAAPAEEEDRESVGTTALATAIVTDAELMPPPGENVRTRTTFIVEG